MFQLKRLSYYLSASILITAISSLFHNAGGALLLWPGFFVETILAGIITLLIPIDEYYFSFPTGTYLLFNGIIYAGGLFGLGEMISLSRIYK